MLFVRCLVCTYICYSSTDCSHFFCYLIWAWGLLVVRWAMIGQEPYCAGMSRQGAPVQMSHMMPLLRTRAWIMDTFRSRKDIVPHPGLPGVGGGAREGIRQRHIAIALRHVLFMQCLHCDEIALQGGHQGLRQQGEAVLGTLPIAHDDLLRGKIEVFHP
jgi:hypothetical protein